MNKNKLTGKEAVIHDAAKALAIVAIGYGRAIEYLSYRDGESHIMYNWKPGTPATDREVRGLCCVGMAGYVAVRIERGEEALPMPGTEPHQLKDLLNEDCASDFLLLSSELDKLREKWNEEDRRDAMRRGMRDFADIYKGKRDAVVKIADTIMARGKLHGNVIINELGRVKFLHGLHFNFDELDKFLHDYPLDYMKETVAKAGLDLATLELSDAFQTKEVNDIACTLKLVYNMLYSINEAAQESLPTFSEEPTQPEQPTQGSLFAGEEEQPDTINGRRWKVVEIMKNLKVRQSAEFDADQYNTNRTYKSSLRKVGLEYQVNKRPDKIIVTRIK